jgi:hypothetical protein
MALGIYRTYHQFLIDLATLIDFEIYGIGGGASVLHDSTAFRSFVRNRLLTLRGWQVQFSSIEC